MLSTPKSLRLQIGVFGRRNVGKSSLVNAIAGQRVSIVDAAPGTTTDPVDKAMELLPVGPVLFMDTAGLDDVGGLGGKRMDATRKVQERADAALLVTEAGGWGELEEALGAAFQKRNVPVMVVINKCDLAAPAPEELARFKDLGLPTLCVSAETGEGIAGFRETLIRAMPDRMFDRQVILGDLVPAGGLVVMVVPIDLEAPKGRLIMPQVQSLRDALDHDLTAVVVKDRELRAALDRLKGPPDLIVTDSQALLRVAGDCPPGVPMTSFSILFARLKGDLREYVRGAMAVDDLRNGDRVLVAESCTHHPIGDDIGRVKIPRWLTQYTGRRIVFETTEGHDFTPDPARYRLVIQCGGCMFNRREIMCRMARCKAAGVPVTNYGVVIAKSLGLIDRALTPFPGILDDAAAGGPADVTTSDQTKKDGL